MLSVETKVVPFNPSNTVLDNVRTMSKDEFIENHGSGTLRKNTRLGMKNHNHYMDERIAYEFGWEFMAPMATRVTIGNAMSEGDVKGNTELGWHAERYLSTRVFPEDKAQVAYIIYEDEEGNKREGNGIVITETSFDLGPGRIIFALVQEYDAKAEQWLPAVNPF